MLLIASILAGCAPEKRQSGTRIDSDLWNLLDQEQTQGSVELLLGPPTIASYTEPRWYYVFEARQRIWFQSEQVVKRTIVVLDFDPTNGTLQRHRRYQQEGASLPAKIEPESEITEISGVEIGLLKEVFGNIGSIYATQ